MPLSQGELDAIDFRELTEEKGGPTRAGFIPDGGKLTASYLYTPEEGATADLLQAKILELVGNTNYGAGDGRLQRQLPKKYPFFSRLYCAGVPEVVGVGKPDTLAADDPDPHTLPYYALYPQYVFKVDFTTRNYNLAEDDQISLVEDVWYDEQGNGVSIRYANEWLRFTDYKYEPQANFATAKYGQTVFRTGTADPSGTNPNKVPFPGEPRVLLPDALVRFTWYMVPERYVTSPRSYLQRFRGMINQTDWYRWKAGELLYLNFTPTRYTPPFPEQESVDGVLSDEKLVNIEFTFLETKRTLDESLGLPEVSNRNFIAAGHNLMPWFKTRQFYYVTSQDRDHPDDPALQVPLFFSAPFPLLFTDPDAEGP